MAIAMGLIIQQFVDLLVVNFVVVAVEEIPGLANSDFDQSEIIVPQDFLENASVFVYQRKQK